jgi:hypothetical protein
MPGEKKFSGKCLQALLQLDFESQPVSRTSCQDMQNSLAQKSAEEDDDE